MMTNQVQTRMTASYWMVDPHEQFVEGKFMLLDVCGAEETFASPISGTVEAKEIFSESA